MEETLQCKFEEDGKQHRLNKTLLTFRETGQRDDGSLTKQVKDFGETKQEETESQRDLDTNKEGPRKDSEEQKKPLKMERKDQEYEMINAGAQMKPGENEITELQKLNKEIPLQEQEWEESAWQMPQLEVREPEQQIRKEEEVARTAEIHKQHKRQYQEQPENTGLLEYLHCKQEDETIKHKEHATQQEEEIQIVLLQKTDQWRTGEYEQHMKKIEYLESRKRDLGTAMFENLKEELQKEHLEKKGLTRRIFEKDKQGNATMEQSEHATQQKLLLNKVQFGIGEYTGYSEMPTGNLGLRPLLIDTTDLEQLKQKLREEHHKNAEKVENDYKTIKQKTKSVFLKIGKSVRKWLSSLFEDKDLKRKPVDPKFGKLPPL